MINKDLNIVNITVNQHIQPYLLQINLKLDENVNFSVNIVNASTLLYDYLILLFNNINDKYHCAFINELFKLPRENSKISKNILMDLIGKYVIDKSEVCHQLFFQIQTNTQSELLLELFYQLTNIFLQNNDVLKINNKYITDIIYSKIKFNRITLTCVIKSIIDLCLNDDNIISININELNKNELRQLLRILIINNKFNHCHMFVQYLNISAQKYDNIIINEILMNENTDFDENIFVLLPTINYVDVDLIMNIDPCLLIKKILQINTDVYLSYKCRKSKIDIILEALCDVNLFFNNHQICINIFKYINYQILNKNNINVLCFLINLCKSNYYLHTDVIGILQLYTFAGAEGFELKEFKKCTFEQFNFICSLHKLDNGNTFLNDITYATLKILISNYINKIDFCFSEPYKSVIDIINIILEHIRNSLLVCELVFYILDVVKKINGKLT